MKKKILVVVDMQNDFISGSLGTKEAEAIVESVVRKIISYPTGNIYATRDSHGEDYLQTAEGKKLPVKHCIMGTEGWELEQNVRKSLSGAKIIDKPTFGSLKLAEILEKEAQNSELEIEMVGVCTDICVVTNALLLKTCLPNAEIIVDSACCAGTTPGAHEAALEVMKSCQIEVR